MELTAAGTAPDSHRYSLSILSAAGRLKLDGYKGSIFSFTLFSFFLFYSTGASIALRFGKDSSIARGDLFFQRIDIFVRYAVVFDCCRRSMLVGDNIAVRTVHGIGGQYA